MSNDTTPPGDMDAAIHALVPWLMRAMREARVSHPALPLPVLAGAAAMALRMLALEDAIALQAREDAGELVPLPPASLKLEMIAEFTLAMRGSGFP